MIIDSAEQYWIKMSIVSFINNTLDLTSSESPPKISFVFVKKDAEMTEQMLLAFEVSYIHW